VSTVSPASRHNLTDAQWAVLVPRHVCPRQLVDAAAAFNQEPSPRGATGASGIALADFGPRMSWSACHPHAISEGQSRYRADNHGHCHPTAELALSRSSSKNTSREYA
jgi:hypothetical protein